MIVLFMRRAVVHVVTAESVSQSELVSGQYDVVAVVALSF